MRKKLLAIACICFVLVAATPVLAWVQLDNPTEGFWFWVTEGAWFDGSVDPYASGVRYGFMDLEIPPNWLKNAWTAHSNGSWAKSLETPDFDGPCEAWGVAMYGSTEGASDFHSGEIHNQ